MRIAIIDVDGHNGFPNLALMKLSAYHKSVGDTVEAGMCFGHFDKAYMSKVFTFSPDFNTVIDADVTVKGGMGYMCFDTLAPEVDSCSAAFFDFLQKVLTYVLQYVTIITEIETRRGAS
jgi:hypothetical protein